MTDKIISQTLERFFKNFNQSVSFQKQEIILRPETDPRRVYFLQQGYVRLYSLTDLGKEITLNIFKPGTYFSMIWAIGNISNHFFFESITKVEVWVAPKDKLQQFLQNNPQILMDLTRRIMVGLDGVLTRQNYLVFSSAQTRVATALVLLAKKIGRAHV